MITVERLEQEPPFLTEFREILTAGTTLPVLTLLETWRRKMSLSSDATNEQILARVFQPNEPGYEACLQGYRHDFARAMRGELVLSDLTVRSITVTQESLTVGVGLICHENSRQDTSVLSLLNLSTGKILPVDEVAGEPRSLIRTGRVGDRAVLVMRAIHQENAVRKAFLIDVATGKPIVFQENGLHPSSETEAMNLRVTVDLPGIYVSLRLRDVIELSLPGERKGRFSLATGEFESFTVNGTPKSFILAAKTEYYIDDEAQYLLVRNSTHSGRPHWQIIDRKAGITVPTGTALIEEMPKVVRCQEGTLVSWYRQDTKSGNNTINVCYSSHAGHLQNARVLSANDRKRVGSVLPTYKDDGSLGGVVVDNAFLYLPESDAIVVLPTESDLDHTPYWNGREVVVESRQKNSIHFMHQDTSCSYTDAAIWRVEHESEPFVSIWIAERKLPSREGLGDTVKTLHMYDRRSGSLTKCLLPDEYQPSYSFDGLKVEFDSQAQKWCVYKETDKGLYILEREAERYSFNRVRLSLTPEKVARYIGHRYVEGRVCLVLQKNSNVDALYHGFSENTPLSLVREVPVEPLDTGLFSSLCHEVTSKTIAWKIEHENRVRFSGTIPHSVDSISGNVSHTIRLEGGEDLYVVTANSRESRRSWGGGEPSSHIALVYTSKGLIQQVPLGIGEKFEIVERMTLNLEFAPFAITHTVAGEGGVRQVGPVYCIDLVSGKKVALGPLELIAFDRCSIASTVGDNGQKLHVLTLNALSIPNQYQSFLLQQSTDGSMSVQSHWLNVGESLDQDVAL